jgi:hypothetical protein
MQSISTIGLDIAKSVFQVHSVDAAGHSLRHERRYHNPRAQSEISRTQARQQRERLLRARTHRRPGLLNHPNFDVYSTRKIHEFHAPSRILVRSNGLLPACGCRTSQSG